MQISVLFQSFNKISIDIFYQETGEIDFTSNLPAVSRVSSNVKAIELPLQISKEFVRKTSDIKYDKTFVLKGKDLRPNYYILSKGKRFNVKESIDIGEGYFMVICSAMASETLR